MCLYGGIWQEIAATHQARGHNGKEKEKAKVADGKEASKVKAKEALA